MKLSLEDVDFRTEIDLDIKVMNLRGSLFTAEFADLPGVSLTGFGNSPSAAKYSLLLRLISSAPGHMDKVQERLGKDLEELDVKVAFEPFPDGSYLIKITNAEGMSRTIEGPRHGMKEAKDDK